jgi:hypothetical protein
MYEANILVLSMYQVVAGLDETCNMTSAPREVQAGSESRVSGRSEQVSKLSEDWAKSTSSARRPAYNPIIINLWLF